MNHEGRVYNLLGREPIAQVIDAFLRGEKAEKGGGVRPEGDRAFKTKPVLSAVEGCGGRCEERRRL